MAAKWLVLDNIGLGLAAVVVVDVYLRARNVEHGVVKVTRKQHVFDSHGEV